MANDFKYAHFRVWDLGMRGRDLGWRGWRERNLIESLEEYPRINRVVIKGGIYRPDKVMKIIMCALEGTQVRALCLRYNAMGSSGAELLANGLRNSNITSLTVLDNKIGSWGAKYLADVLKETRITHLDIRDDIEVEGMKHLAEGLKNTCINSLKVGHKDIGIEGVKCVADVLKYTNITSLFLEYGNCGREMPNTFLAEVVEDTQITELEFNSRTAGYISCITLTCIHEAIAKNKKIACKIQDAFLKLVVQNTQTGDLEFIFPTETESLDFSDYLYFIKTVNDSPRVKAHILCIFYKNNRDTYDLNIIQKVNEFVTTLPAKFNTFINNNLLVLVNLFPTYDYVDLVKQCEDSRLSDIVKNLLLHRELYYVDDDQEILHPYIYKMLYNYGMPLYNEQIDNDKKENLIFYFQNHVEIDGAHRR